jgi:hypothetical protein
MVQQKRRRQARIDYTRTCWSCGKDVMACRGEYYICTSCGATWNETPRPGQEELVEVNRWSGKPARPGDDAIYSPSKAVQRRAARARGDL